MGVRADRAELQSLRLDGWRLVADSQMPGLEEAVALAEGEAPPTARILRQAPGRTVYALRLGDDRPVVVKVFRDVTIWDRLRRALRTRARAEWRALGRAAGRGLPVPRRLALGESRGFSILVLEEFTGHETLASLLDRAHVLSPDDRQRLVEQFADLVSQVHRAGLRHRDLHPGNVMVRRGADKLHQEDALVLLDLHRARFHRRLSLRRRLGDLQDLDLYFAWHGRRVDRVRFGLRYLEALQLRGDPEMRERRVRRLLHGLGQRTLQRSRAFWRDRDRRSRRPSGDFRILSGGHGLVRLRGTSLHLDGVEEVLERADELLGGATERMLKHGTSATSALVALEEGGPLFFLKRYNRSGPREGMKIMMRGTRARRAFRAGWALEVRGIPTARVLGYRDRRDGLSTLVTEAFPHSGNLAQMLRAGCPEGPATGVVWLEGILERAARLLKDLHLKGLSHRDLKTANLLVDRGGELRIVDLDGLVVHRDLVPWRRRARDLARFMADAIERDGLTSPGGQEAFLEQYLQHWLDERPRRREVQAMVWRELEEFLRRHRGRHGTGS